MNSARRDSRGFNLLELLIALVISLALIAAFLAVLQRSRRDLAVNESLARLQDSARQALGVIATDIEHAGFYGFSPATRVRLVRGGAELATELDLHQPDAAHATTAVPGLPAGAHDCGVNFAVDLARPAQGADNHYALGSAARACAPTASAGGASGSADTLTLRHASLATAAPRAGRLQVYSSALAADGPLLLFADGNAPGPIDDQHQIRDLEVRSYYVSRNSVERDGWPALRVKGLTDSRGAAQFRDEEILQGVEDLQVELGVARVEDGVKRVAFVTADSPIDGQIIAVRLWLRLRADVTESGYRDSRTWSYANTTFSPDAVESRQRRLLVSRTVTLRNATS